MTRIVVHAEGAGELLGSITQLPPVGAQLPFEALGPAHLLIGRLCGDAGGPRPGQVRFDSPNRIRGRLARGSDLLSERTLRQLLTWARPEQHPELAIVLVDADGDLQRANRLRQIVNGLKVPTVVTASVQEFEAWLVADHACVRQVLATASLDGAPDNPEALQPGVAKALLTRWMASAGRAGSEDQRAARREIAAQCMLEVLRLRCRAFATFASELASRTLP